MTPKNEFNILDESCSFHRPEKEDQQQIRGLREPEIYWSADIATKKNQCGCNYPAGLRLIDEAIMKIGNQLPAGCHWFFFFFVPFSSGWSVWKIQICRSFSNWLRQYWRANINGFREHLLVKKLISFASVGQTNGNQEDCSQVKFATWGRCCHHASTFRRLVKSQEIAHERWMIFRQASSPDAGCHVHYAA